MDLLRLNETDALDSAGAQSGAQLNVFVNGSIKERNITTCDNATIAPRPKLAQKGKVTPDH